MSGTAISGCANAPRLLSILHLTKYGSNFGLAAGRSWLHQLFYKRPGSVGRHPELAMDQRAFVQHRLGAVQGGDVGALEKFADGDFLVPEQRFLHRGGPVTRVVSGVVLEFLHARTEPLIRIVVIVGDAGTEDIEEREALVLDTLLDQFGEMLLLAAETASDESGAR